MRAGAFFDPSFLAARDLFAAVRFFAERLAGERFFVALARAGRLVVFFAEFARAAAFVRAGRFFFAVRETICTDCPVVSSPYIPAAEMPMPCCPRLMRRRWNLLP